MNKKSSVITAFIGAICLLPGAALAACTLTSGPGQMNVNFGTVIVQRDTAPGTMIAFKDFAVGGVSVNCTTAWTYAGKVSLFSTPDPYGNNVYATNIPGVGISMHMGGSASSYFPWSISRNAMVLSLAGTAWVALVKTSVGAVGGGNVTNGTLGTFNADSLTMYTINLTGSNIIVPVACHVMNTSITVPMGAVARNTFTGIGHTGSDVPFAIPLACDSQASVKVTIDAPADSSGAAGVMALTGAGSAGVASGVGIQLTQSATPVVFGSSIPIANPTGGLVNIPLIARYYQTLPNVTAGDANAQATFTMTYN